MTEKPLKIYAINDYTMGPYNYYVITPCNEYMHFETKKQAKEFIEFYNEYTTKKQLDK
jgi:hypothetical protein